MIKIEYDMSRPHYSNAHSKEMSELGFPVNRLVCWTALLRSQLLVNPHRPSSYISAKGGMFITYLATSLHPLFPVKQSCSVHMTPLLSSTQICLPYIFYPPIQDEANIFDNFSGKYKWPCLDSNRKTGSEASRGPAEPCLFLHHDK